MAKDLTPKFKNLLAAEQELVTPYVAGAMPFAESIGGLQAFSRVFKRGQGDNVFGSDDNGIWLGAADFEDAPFKVGMDGTLTILSGNLNII
jgi:hypothetical protein